MRALAHMLALYMLLGSLFPGSDFSQLSRIPSLLDHFAQHREMANQKDDQLSFLQFVRMHFYQTNQHADHSGEHDHQNLPLQSISLHLEFTISAFSLPEISCPFTETQSAFAYQAPQGSNYAATFLQPPIV